LAAAFGVLEELGVESVWVGEHVVVPRRMIPAYPGTSDGSFPYPFEVSIPSPIVWLSFAAGLTSTIKLGTQVLILPHHNALVLAKEVATLDRLSRGRVLLGVGLGWCQEEAAMVGYRFADRTGRADDSIRAMRALWSRDETYNGRWWSFEQACSNPKPFSEHGVPVIVGGTSPGAARRAGRLGDGFFPYVSNAAELRPLVVTMRAAASGEERDPDRIELTCPLRLSADGHRAALRSAIVEWAEMGVSRVVVGCPDLRDVAAVRAGLEPVVADVAATKS